MNSDEICHVFGLGHPDSKIGPAPLPKTQLSKRLMLSSISDNPISKSLVKAEWEVVQQAAKRIETDRQP